MAERIVDGLEIVQIDEQDRRQDVVATGFECFGDPGDHVGAVGQPGQRVVCGLVGEPFAGGALCGDVGE